MEESMFASDELRRVPNETYRDVGCYSLPFWRDLMRPEQN